MRQIEHHSPQFSHSKFSPILYASIIGSGQLCQHDFLAQYTRCLKSSVIIGRLAVWLRYQYTLIEQSFYSIEYAQPRVNILSIFWHFIL